MLRQIEWRLQNGPITKSGVLPVTTLFFWQIFSSFRASEKELIRCASKPIFVFFEFNFRVLFPCILKGHSHIESSHSLRQIDASGWVDLTSRFDT